MRPTRLEVEGFSAYREAVEVDFTDTDFFSLTGPTGAGKSSLIDAMIFALYGRVPRLGAREIAPAITAGADRARVRLDFEVGGSKYTSVRLATRTKSGGATVKEARLQKTDQVLASGGPDVSEAVEDLLKLSFDDFTRTVVLPQGDFARFLAATKAERQGLLRNLLGLDVYTRMRELAKTRGAVATERAGSARRALDALDVPDEKTAAAAVKRRDSLEQLSEQIAEEERKLSELDQAVAEARTEAERITAAVERLRAISPPDRLEELDALTVKARDESETANEALTRSRETIAGLEQAMADLPTPHQLGTWKSIRAKLDRLEVRLDEKPLTEAIEKRDVVAAKLSDTKTSLETVRGELTAARRQHAAHTLTASLVTGEPCPVCAQEVTELPETENLPAIADLESSEKTLVGQVEAIQKEADSVHAEVTSLETARHEIETQKESLLADLSEAPDLEGTEKISRELERLQTELTAAKEQLGVREAAAKEAQKRLEDLAETSRRIGRKLTEAQLAVAELEPPLSESDDVIIQWKELLAWRDSRLDELGPTLEEAQESIARAGSKAAEARNKLIATLEKQKIPPQEPFAVQVATALQQARSTVESHEKAVSDSAEFTKQAESATTEAAVAAALANHLKANGFEQWLMAGALTELVDGANDLLSQLSGGGYSLHSDESGTFSIIDHRNADEMRSVATLSGGETFLVSLALALSLAETLAAKGGSGLDAIMLDEGFGTLDDESLDTVASVLEELTGRGLMVGVITHVKELAARAPVRFEVTREPTGAQVRMVS